MRIKCDSWAKILNVYGICDLNAWPGNATINFKLKSSSFHWLVW